MTNSRIASHIYTNTHLQP